ncbi:MAG: SDR family oxidoreductase [Candidatus Thiodiazotropha endolucinida]|nr:SDR family oxidoreductase [Candidatus Thiodiazotropha taylori]MCG8096507.1 SDR family oxidoreductase [Candidatus Thiodiazotropha endolucinida]
MRILITGATGFIGSHLTQALLERGHIVLVCVRNPEPAKQRWPDIIPIKVDFSVDHEVEHWIGRLEGVDVVINAVGIIRETRTQTFDLLHRQTPIALFKACEKAAVKRVIQVSALGADDEAFSHYHLSKRVADCYLRASPIDWVIVMPSIVYGAGAKSMAFFKALSALPVIPLIDRGDQPIQPIHINDLTRAVVALVESPGVLRSDVEMVGPVPIRIKALYSKLRQWLNLRQGRFISIPYRLSLHAAKWAGLLGEIPITKEAVAMLRKGNTASVAPFIARFGFQPRSVEQAFIELPAQQADRWHAGLYFLAPLLRLSIAFLWLYTALVSAFLFPLDQSYAMLAQVGILGDWQTIVLYGATTTDLLLGLAILFAYRLQLVVLLQVGIILLYSAIILLWLPEYWLHPFGPMSKNLPLLVALMIVLVTQRR